MERAGVAIGGAGVWRGVCSCLSADQRRDSSLHAEKNLAFRLSGCESPGPSRQEAEEFDKVSPWAGV